MSGTAGGVVGLVSCGVWLLVIVVGVSRSAPIMAGMCILGGAAVFALWVIRRMAGKRTRESSKAPS